jgi:L-iditol 2-dehydrogenase
VKAAVYDRPGHVQVTEIPKPACPAGGLLTRVRACAVCGSDLRTYQEAQREPGLVQGHEAVLEIIEVAPGVTEFSVGQRVMLAPAGCGSCEFCEAGHPNMCIRKSAARSVKQGGFAEYRPVGPESLKGGYVIPLPDELDDLGATLIEPLACVLNGHDRVRVFPGDSVAIIGGGPIGSLHIQVSKIRGASNIILFDRSDSRLARNAALGATHALKAEGDSPVQLAREITHGLGVHLSVVACVAPEAPGQAVRMARIQGQVLMFSALPTTAPEAAININLIHNNEITVVGARSAAPRHFRIARDLLANRQIDGSSLITHVFPLEQIDEAFALGRAGLGHKIVIRP